MNKYVKKEEVKYKPATDEERLEFKQRAKKREQEDHIEYTKWWKTLTPQQQKEHDDDVSRLCDVEI